MVQYTLMEDIMSLVGMLMIALWAVILAITGLFSAPSSSKTDTLGSGRYETTPLSAKIIAWTIPLLPIGIIMFYIGSKMSE